MDSIRLQATELRQLKPTEPKGSSATQRMQGRVNGRRIQQSAGTSREKSAVGFANAVGHPAMRCTEPGIEPGTELDTELEPVLGLGLELDIEPDTSETLAHGWRTGARADFLLKPGQDCERSVG